MGLRRRACCPDRRGGSSPGAIRGSRSRLTLVVGWAGLRGAVSLAAALALPATFPERNLILLITFVVILVTLVGQGLTLPWFVRRAGWDGVEPDGDEATLARTAAYQAGLDEIARARPEWPGPRCRCFDRLESGLRDRTQHLATEDPDETAERRQERIEHEEIQRGVIVGPAHRGHRAPRPAARSTTRPCA